jgi:NTP pyrophosphatase (non-canonical NTP hydrolase)
MIIKHVMASAKDRKPTILNTDMEKFLGNDLVFLTEPQVALFYPSYSCVIYYHQTRNGSTWYGDRPLPKHAIQPQVGKPAMLDVERYYPILDNQLEPIRQWALDRQLIQKGNPDTQIVKLMEEVGELAQANLRNDETEFLDALGDVVVVLTNLAAMRGYKLESCINIAYNTIKNRQGKMVNNTFVKN